MKFYNIKRDACVGGKKINKKEKKNIVQRSNKSSTNYACALDLPFHHYFNTHKNLAHVA